MVDLFVDRAMKVKREPGEQNGTDDMQMDIDFQFLAFVSADCGSSLTSLVVPCKHALE